ncbi:MAG: peptidoglycan-binding protein [Actinobacteria bacterium]|nr:peptidoglycan-binding protein [Actinomycetota bacterium]MCB8996321.1 peptidoglycan-binding protein [Actinomycetota bacterium]HRY10451.1 peptidoglycan-binding protein [Candidatus Nanopelagicales bacterium]
MRRTVIGGIATLALLAPAAPAFADGEPILTSGMEHRAVKRVQKLLGVSPQTGYFGPVTLAAVKTYQRAHGIPTTGVVGPLTWASLLEQQKTKRTQAKKSKQKAAKKKAAKKKVAKKKTKKKSASSALKAATLQLGDRGAAVLFLQKELNVQPQTGYFGPITQSFVKALQTAAKIPVTGVVDARTWRKVGKVKFTAPAPAPATAPASTALPAPSNATAAQVLKVAASQAGVPYVATGYSPEQGFNCSSYTQWVYEQVGIDLGGAYTVWQYNKSRKISAAEAKPGDLVFFYNYKDNFIGHVGIYAGNGMMWHAPRTGRVVSLERVYTDKVYYGRVLNQ